jgi:hypothetical protein
MEYALIYAFIALLIGGTCGVVAIGKHRSGFGWFLLGTAFGFLALIAICFLRPLPETKPLAVVTVRIDPMTNNPIREN